MITFTCRECIFMIINCVASGLTYMCMLMLDMNDLSIACPHLEDLMLIVLVLRIYILPVICIFKLGLHWCGQHGDKVDAIFLMIFVCIETHYCIGQAFRQKECYNFLQTQGNGLTLAIVIVATVFDLIRVFIHMCCACRTKEKGIRMEQTDPDTNENCKLLEISSSEVDILLEELDDNNNPRK